MPRAGDRFVATVLFADIVGSTEMAAEVGDRRWNAILGAYYDTARREVRRFRGREIDTAGDGFFAAFDTPNDGVRAATAIVESMWARGIPVRAGLHAGECEVIGKKVGGIAVHIGARVAGLAGPGEVVVTSTVRDLAAGSALRFEPLGVRELKGVPGDWNVFEVESEVARPALPPLEVPGLGQPKDRPRRRTALIAVLVAAVAGAVVAAVLLLGGSGASPRTTPTGTGGGGPISPTAPSADAGPTGGPFLGTVAVDAGTGDETTRVPIHLSENADVSGHDVTGGFGFVWVADFNGNMVSKVNPDSGTVVATITVRFPTTVLVHGKDVWVASGSPGCQFCALVRIDASTNQLVDSIQLDTCCGGMAIDGGWLWVLGVNALYRVDLDTGASKKFDVGGDAVAAGRGRVYVLSRALATLTIVNEKTGVVGDPIALSGSSPTFLAYGFGAVWITDRIDGVLTRLPVDGRGGTDTVEVGDSPIGVTAGPDSMWVANAGDGTLSKVNPSSASVDGTFAVGGRPTRVTVAFGSVWTTEVPVPT